jgi:hypothetical protein
MDELLPCPYCNSPAETTTGDYCICSNFECPADGVILSIKEWNTRAPDPRVQRLVEAAKFVLDQPIGSKAEAVVLARQDLRAALADLAVPGEATDGH